MGHLLSRLRIGEKVGLGFGFVGLLFLAVIWQYHSTLEHSLADYRSLIEIHDAKKDLLLEIRAGMLDARRAEKNFLLHRNEAAATEVSGRVDAVLALTAQLGRIDEESGQVARECADLIGIYHQRFEAIAQAWRRKGLDHNSGLQGAFRDAVHELEDLAGQFKVSSLYLQLLQVRRREKDLGLRREEAYHKQVIALLAGLRRDVGDSGLEPTVKASLVKELAAYERSFEEYSQRVLAQEDIQGGKGPFRQAAHRIEAILRAHYIPGMEPNILQLRRREKDYLLRHDKQYVEMALREWQRITEQVDGSGVSQEDKARLRVLLTQYRRDFLALVKQNDEIVSLSSEMREAVGQITPIVKSKVEEADRLEAEMTAKIEASSRDNERNMLWIVLTATALGILFAVTITLQITRPLRRMMGLLGRLADEDPTERIATRPGSRDEVELMAESVNAIADHKAGLIRWWMKEHDLPVAS
ncbi:MAG: hypothetical protein ACR2PM_08050 [Hyphomicrobiales bacterium]